MPHQDASPGAGDELRPTWDLYRRMASSPNVRPARRDAVLWALGELERRMGPDWLERYWESAGHVPAEVNLGSGHVAAFGNLLDLALRYHVLDGAPGIGQVQRDMRNDLRDERRWHSALQLEVAALGAHAGFTAALEARAAGRVAPSDVILRRDGQLLQVETFVILRDECSQEAARHWDWLMAQIRNIGWRSDVGISGDLGERLDRDASAELLRLVEAAAQAAVTTRQEQPVEFRGARLRLLPPGSTTHQLRGGVEEGKAGPVSRRSLPRKLARRPAPGAGGCGPTSWTACGSSRRGRAPGCELRSTRSPASSSRFSGRSRASRVSCSPAARSSRRASSTANRPPQKTGVTGSGGCCPQHASARP